MNRIIDFNLLLPKWNRGAEGPIFYSPYTDETLWVTERDGCFKTVSTIQSVLHAAYVNDSIMWRTLLNNQQFVSLIVLGSHKVIVIWVCKPLACPHPYNSYTDSLSHITYSKIIFHDSFMQSVSALSFSNVQLFFPVLQNLYFIQDHKYLQMCSFT